MTSSESADHSGTKYCLAAASAFETVGFEMMTHSASWVWDLRVATVFLSRSLGVGIERVTLRATGLSPHDLASTTAGTT